MADVYRSSTALRRVEKSFDRTIVVSITVIAIGLVVALCLLTGAAGYTPDDLGLMNAYP
ncbi:MAG TPA: hypothetical protein VKB76_17440 [Ktedonobacterales bacterium]|jgi:hypothetical protein|nr:hypothetical protein [Ktedonobacterales bacterium]